MVTFQTLYTGQDSAVKLPDLARMEQAQRRVGEQAIRSEEAKLSKSMQDEDQALEMLKSNPTPLISGRNRTRQAVAIEEYTNKWAGRLAELGGELTFSDKIEMQRDKDMLTGFQEQLLLDEQRFMQSEELLKRDTRGFYDKKRWDESVREFYETGELPQDALVARPRDFRSALANSGAVFTQSFDTETFILNGSPHRRDVTVNMTEEEARRFVADTMMSDEGYIRYVIEDFLSQPEEIQARYLDVDGDGVIDPTERQAVQGIEDINNPVVRWAQDEYAKYAQKKAYSGTQRVIASSPTSRPTVSGFDPKQGISSTNNRNEEFPASEQGVSLGGFRFDSWVKLPKGATAEEIFTVSQAWREDGTPIKISTAGLVNAEVVGYSPSEDQVVIRAKGRSSLGVITTEEGEMVPGGVLEGDVLVLPAAEYDDVLRRQFGIDRTAYPSFRGKQESASDLRRRMEALKTGTGK